MSDRLKNQFFTTLFCRGKWLQNPRDVLVIINDECSRIDWYDLVVSQGLFHVFYVEANQRKYFFPDWIKLTNENYTLTFPLFRNQMAYSELKYCLNLTDIFTNSYNYTFYLYVTFYWRILWSCELSFKKFAECREITIRMILSNWSTEPCLGYRSEKMTELNVWKRKCDCSHN